MGLDIILYRAEKLDGRNPREMQKLEFSQRSNIHVFTTHDLEDETIKEFNEFFKDFIFDFEEDFYDIDHLLEKEGYTWDDIETNDHSYAYRNDTFYPGCFKFTMKDGKVLTFDNVGLVSEPAKGLLCQEVGYQRKGANKAFYEDDMWNSGKPIFTMKTLLEHWEKYFSGEGNVKGEGGIQFDGENLTVEKDVPFGFGVEYALDADENRKNFKENIIDKFVEGETFVVYC